LENIMLKFITSAIVAGSFALGAPQDASACSGGSGCGGGLRGLCGGNKTCAAAPAAACEAQPAAPASPAATPDMPDMAPPAPTTAQNSTKTYRTYSYDPAPAYRAPAARSNGSSRSWQQDQFNAGRKMRGL
jgi:hypothetical protein